MPIERLVAASLLAMGPAGWLVFCQLRASRALPNLEQPSPCAVPPFGTSGWGYRKGSVFDVQKQQSRPASRLKAAPELRSDFRGLSLDSVGALTRLVLDGRDRQGHLLAERARNKPTDTMCLPAGGFHN